MPIKKLRDMGLEERTDEIFHFIEKAILTSKKDEITPYHDMYEIPDDTTVVILDKWKGRLARKIAEVV